MSPSRSSVVRRPRTVDVPIHSGAPNPGLVPIALSVESQPRTRAWSQYHGVSRGGPDDVPPSILYVHMIKRGIAITFSKPMAPATVTNIRNYAVKFSPIAEVQPCRLGGCRPDPDARQHVATIALKRAVYDPATNTVILIPKVSLSSASGTFQISSPASLSSKRANPHKAQPLTDAQGNVIDSNGSRGEVLDHDQQGHPYVAAQPQFSPMGVDQGCSSTVRA